MNFTDGDSEMADNRRRASEEHSQVEQSIFCDLLKINLKTYRI